MFTDPVKNLKAFELRENMIVADLGAGTGHYSIAAAKLVPLGKVYAVEVQKDYLATIKSKIEEEHLHNIELILGNIETPGGTKLKDHIVDAVIASNILFQIENKDKLIEEIKRILKKEGKLILIDWSDTSSILGPTFNRIISKEKARSMFESNGFVWQRDIDAGAHHYGIILTKINE